MRTSRPIPLSLATGLSLAAALPFAWTPVPPLTDVSGHIGRFAVQVAPAGSPLLDYFWFHWALVLNLAADLIVQLFHPWIAIMPLTRLICAATVALTTLGILMIARVANPRGASTVTWALLFVFNFPFLWGFLNFALTLAGALLALAGWIALAGRPRWRLALAIIAPPVLLVGHGVAGILFVGTVTGWEAGEAMQRGERRDAVLARARAVAPAIVATLVLLAVWLAVGAHDRGPTVWLPMRKVEAVQMMLRDQSRLLDEGSVAACLVMWGIGWIWGARLRGGALGIALFVVALFVATPSLISGSDRIDTRLAPVIPMLAFALQDWRGVNDRRRRLAFVVGAVLLLVRFGVTTASFADYARQYRIELTALDHVPRGARILNLSRVDCADTAWRSERLEHLANLATPLRDAWVNAHWSIAGVQLLGLRYAASPAYARDPSQLVWPAACIDFRHPFAERDRHTLVESIPALPLDRADYLWLVGERLPPDRREPRLRLVWADDLSELYAIATPPGAARPSPLP